MVVLSKSRPHSILTVFVEVRSEGAASGLVDLKKRRNACETAGDSANRVGDGADCHS